MKPSEFERVNEDLKSAIAKTGLLGQTEKLSAQQSAKQQKIYKLAGKNFQNQLFKALSSAQSSGLISQPGSQSSSASTATSAPTTKAASTTPTPPEGQETVSSVPPGKMLVIPRTGIAEYYKIGTQWFNALGEKISDPKQTQVLDNKADAGGAREQNVQKTAVGKKTRTNEGYDALNTLLERQIIKEQENVSDFVFDFVMSQASNLEQKPAYVKRAKELSTEIQKQYDQTGKIPNPNSFQPLWDLLWTWNQTSSDSRKQQQTARNTDAATSQDNQASSPETQRKEFQQSIINSLKSVDFNDGSSQTIDTLEKISKMLSDYVSKAKNPQA